MTNKAYFRSLLAGAVCGIVLATNAYATNFDIPGGDLAMALDAYTTQTGIALIISENAVKGIHSRGVRGGVSADEALARILAGTGFSAHRESGAVMIVRDGAKPTRAGDPSSLNIAAATAPSVSGAALETVTVTSSKIGGDVQNIPISITALSQEQLTATQTAGGPDLVKQVPNMTFTKTNFSGYSIQLRGIGTQAISVTTDPAVAVAFNDIPFIRNHFFEQEFYDVSQVEVLRGPQGTLYGRNATAGVVNLISAKPSDQFEAMASADIGNYGNRRLEGMLNMPVVDDRLDIRLAGEWTKRQGYSFNEITDQRIDGRDLWSSRLSIGIKPASNVQAYLVWEHFSEDDDRMRSAKQLCKTAPIPPTIDGVSIGNPAIGDGYYLSQGCLPTSLYSLDAFEVPNGFSLPYIGGIQGAGQEGSVALPIVHGFDVYASATQSRNLRVIESALNPTYRAKNDVVEMNIDYAISSALAFTSQTAFNHDFLWSTEDYNRFNTNPGVFVYVPQEFGTEITPDGKFCDPQLGCSDRLVAEDLSDEHAWQFSQEFRLASNFSGPLNFSAGGNYLHYETEENYYVFINTLTMFKAPSDWNPGVSDNHECLPQGYSLGDPSKGGGPFDCAYIDPNPIGQMNNNGHNYFLSQNPYVLNSYAVFGEANYNILSDLKLTTGLRWTDDQKHFTDIPSELIVGGWGYPVTGVVNQQWDQFSGRAAVNWTSKLSFTDQTLIYGSYAHGYKAGGANPPGAVLLVFTLVDGTTKGDQVGNPIHPLTFKPEFVDAFEIGSKNTLLDGALTLNGDVFYYNYENYQISEIVDRSAINLNFDTHVKGAELEATWEPVAALRFNFAGGWEDTALARGTQAVDLMDRTDAAHHPDWVVMKPFITQASNCIMPAYVVAAALQVQLEQDLEACGITYISHWDPVTLAPYVANPTATANGNPVPAGYKGFDPLSAPNNGQGFDKDLSGNELPNAPRFTLSAGAQYTLPLTPDWAGTLRTDLYWQSSSFARVFNDRPYDQIHGYSNVNLTLIFTNQNGWQVMLYDKNVFNTTAITGDFLNSDDSGLTTNVFLTDPKLIGIRVTKNW